jgi:FeS assembly SUF system protein
MDPETPRTEPPSGPEPRPEEFKPAHARPSTTVDPVARNLELQVVEALRSCYDPEIPVNIYELGLIYDVRVEPGGAVAIVMTLTSPMCPVAGTLPGDVEARIRAIPGVTSCRAEVTWEPPWGPDKMTDAAKLQLNMM